jgi:hypothetical protein
MDDSNKDTPPPALLIGQLGGEGPSLWDSIEAEAKEGVNSDSEEKTPHQIMMETRRRLGFFHPPEPEPLKPAMALYWGVGFGILTLGVGVGYIILFGSWISISRTNSKRAKWRKEQGPVVETMWQEAGRSGGPQTLPASRGVSVYIGGLLLMFVAPMISFSVLQDPDLGFMASLGFFLVGIMTILYGNILRSAQKKSADVRIRYLEGELGLKPPMNLLPEGMNSNI